MPKSLFAIVCTLPCSGVTPMEDRAMVDCWYSDKGMARGAYEMALELYPEWVVALVEQKSIRWPNSRIGAAGDMATKRPNVATCRLSTEPVSPDEVGDTGT